MAHLVVAGLVIDIGVRSEMLSRKVLVEQPDEFWVWAFEGGTGTRNSFGVQMYSDEQRRAACGQMWHRRLKRATELKIDGADVALLGEIFEQGGVKAASLSGAQQTQVLKLAFYRLLAKRDAAYRLNIPVIAGADGRALHTEVGRIAREIIAQAVVPAMAEADEIYLASGLSRAAGNYRHAFARLLLECSIDKVVEDELIPAFPETAAHNWRTWLSLGDCVNELHLGEA